MFKKNQEVTVIALWSQGRPDSKLSQQVRFSVDHAVVHSCGKVQMILASETESYKGKNFRPQIEQYGDEQVHPRMSTEDALRLADELAVAYCAKQVAQLNVVLERTAGKYGQAYTDSMTRQRDHYAATPIAPAKLLSELRASLRRS